MKMFLLAENFKFLKLRHVWWGPFYRDAELGNTAADFSN
jgi:hypothetical protein